jgi:glc operon protein GlcG
MALTLAQAQAAVSKAVDTATAQNLRIVAVVVDSGGRVVALARMDGCSYVNVSAATRKAATAAAFGIPTHQLNAMVSRDDVLKGSLIADSELSPLPGGVPLKDGDSVVGGLGIAGAFYLQDQAVAEYTVS